LGAGELNTLSLALDHPEHIVLVDDELARRIAQSAGLRVWGSLRVLLVAKEQGLVEIIEPLVDDLAASGMWISAGVRERILRLAGE
jgi:predicted nucleic acid-binding protein